MGMISGLSAASVGRTSWIVAALLLLAGELLAALNRIKGEQEDDLVWLFFILGFSIATVGSLILSHHRAHAIGWLLLTVGLLFELSFASTEYALYTLETNPGALPFGIEVAVLAWVGGTAFFLLTSLLLLLFPDGRPISPRWNVVIVPAVVGIVLASTSEFMTPGNFTEPLENWANPIGVDAPDLISAMNQIGSVLIALCGLAGATSLVLRVRRSDQVVKEQLKWVAFSGVMFIAFWLFGLAAQEAGLISERGQQATVLVGLALIPVSAGVAILRYRLYDIDWIINRTLVYVPLTAVLAGVYIAMTGILRTLLADSTGGNSDFAIAMTTVVVVAMLTPMKNYLQERVDRRFKENGTPARELKKLVSESRPAIEVLDADRFVQRFVEETRSILGALVVEVRLAGRLDVYRAGNGDSPALLSLGLRHDGLELGEIGIGARGSGQPYTGEELEALQEAADLLAYRLSLGFFVAAE
jgi:hypothetical protein